MQDPGLAVDLLIALPGQWIEFFSSSFHRLLTVALLRLWALCRAFFPGPQTYTPKTSSSSSQ